MNNIILTDKQKEYIHNAVHRWNFKVGATGAGKTFIDSLYIIPQRIIERKEQQGLSVIMGVTRETIERNILQPMRGYYGNMVSDINNRNICRMFGEDVYCLGAEKINQVSKIQGATFKYLYCDEVVKWNKEVFNFAKSRLRASSSLADLTCNPENPTHFIKMFLDSDADIYNQHYVIDDNPFYPEKEKEELKKEYAGTVYYDRYILGLWKQAEGLIYSNFNKDLHIVPTIDRNYTEYQISMDYGTYNPCVAQLWGLCNGVWYCIKEYWYDGREKGVQKDDEQYHNDICTFAGNLPIRRIIIDPSASSFIAFCRRKGKFHMTNADNSVLDGIRSLQTALNMGLIKYNDCCIHTIAEFGLYSWDEKSNEDAPIKEQDHGMDASRYMCYTNKIALPKRKSLLE